MMSDPQPESHRYLRTVQPKRMEEEIDIRELRLSLLFICYPALVDTCHNIQYFFAEAGDENRLLVRRCVQCKRGEELPNGLVKDIRGRKGSRCRGAVFPVSRPWKTRNRA